jgi:PPOX class probable F420-dependent enzyme
MMTGAGGVAPAVADITEFQELLSRDHGLVVVSTLRADGSIASSVVNAGVLPHPVTGDAVVGMVIIGGSRKLGHLRERPRATVAARAGWQWATAEGPVDLIGPADPREEIDAERLRLLLREIFTAAGGTHEDFGEYDRVMAAEGRTAVLVHPRRVYSNPAR